MGKVEIKIRKKILTPDNLQQYRNYPALLKKYERNKRFKRALKIFLYSIALTVFVLALVFISMWKVLLDKSQESSKSPKTYTYLRIAGTKSDTVEYRNFNHYKTDSSYVISYQYDTIKTTVLYRLPIKPLFKDSNFEETITYEESKTIKIEGHNYTIIRYLVSRRGLHSSAFMFYSPDFGLLHIRPSMSYYTYRRLVNTGNSENDKIIRELTREVENDQVFFNRRIP